MHQIIFTSAATREMRPQDLAALMQTMRQRHERLAVTGLLLYCQGAFLHVLEGERDTLTRLYANIEAENYHHGLTTVKTQKVETREFETWAMGFCEMTEAQINDEINELEEKERVPAYSHFMDSSKTVHQLRRLAQKPSFAYETLMRFKGG